MIDLNHALIALKTASRQIALLTSEEKSQALAAIAEALWYGKKQILEANQEEVSAAISAEMQPAMVNRLTLNESRWVAILNDLRSVANLPDPVGIVLDSRILPNGLRVMRQRVPLGVVAVIYESRPNVTVDVVGLTLKSGNALVLRGGKETLKTNTIIIEIIKKALRNTNVPEKAVLFIDDPDRDIVLQLMKRYDLIDILIPRGGAGLHTFCRENSMIPVITGGIGICHLFVDESADLEKSVEVIRNAKVQRPTVCNALDTLLVHERIASTVIPRLVETLRQDGVVFYLDETAFQIIPAAQDIHLAGEGDFDREWLSLTLGIKVVYNLEEAVEHIQRHSTGHSDGIMTEDKNNAEKFIRRIDSAAVYVNASTRYTDGSALGLGAEMAISTQKLHARGPMALEELTTYKWVIQGDYHVRG